MVKQLWSEFHQIQLTQIPREENSRADELSRVDPNNSKATSEILVEVINHPSIETGEVMTINAPDWRSAIIEYLKSPTREIELESAKLRI